LLLHDESADIDRLADALHFTPVGYEAAALLRAALARARNESHVVATERAKF
jgi:hypothetical protein